MSLAFRVGIFGDTSGAVMAVAAVCGWAYLWLITWGRLSKVGSRFWFGTSPSLLSFLHRVKPLSLLLSYTAGDYYF